MSYEHDWQFAEPAGWPSGIQAESAHGVVSVRPVPGRIGRREWVASPLAIIAADDHVVTVANALAPQRVAVIARTGTIDSARRHLVKIGVRTSPSRAAIEDLALLLVEGEAGGNPWGQQAKYERIAA